MFGRAAWTSLSGAFGELRVGRQETLGFAWWGEVSPFFVSYKQAGLDTIFGYRNVDVRADDATRLADSRELSIGMLHRF